MKFLLNKETLSVDFKDVYIIGYAGRDMKKTQEHIDELERDLGVKPPKRIPTIFECSNELVTQEEDLKFVGDMTSGECEYIIIKSADKIYITLGSDHTDRKLESVDMSKAKQVCVKPVAREVWDYEEVKDHWDDILLKSYITVDGEERVYQDGKLADILPVEKILQELDERVGNTEDILVFSGTVPLKDGFVYGEKFRSEMVDEKLDRKIELEYAVNVIGVEEL
ncbi:MAG: DUF2848 family protein [Peptoniphilus sp.]|nr:DUF2848 family protein [Peptoniphilus sp.]